MRSIPEWIGSTDDTKIPDRVRVRVLALYHDCCAMCARRIGPGDKWTCDHIAALVNGGENRESNLQPLCAWGTPEKDKADVAEKAKVYAIRRKHHGIKSRKSRPMPGGRDSPVKIKICGEPVNRKTGEPLRRR